MPYKEINDLRKKGLLEQAIQMAENEFSASQDKLEATSLFWCLNDKLKLANYDTSSDACRECFERMQTIAVR